MNPRQSEEYSEAQRQSIIDATWELFAERGYHETTMREIASRLGMTTGVLYTYFSGKEEILAALAERSRGRTTAMLEKLLDEGSARQAIGKLFDMVAESWTTERGRLGIKANLNLMAEAGRRDDLRQTAHDLHASMVSVFGRLTRKGVENGEFGECGDPEALAAFLGTVFIGLQTVMVFVGEDAGEHIRAVRSILLRPDARDSGGKEDPLDARRQEEGGDRTDG